MKVIGIDDVWPRQVIETYDGLGRVLHVRSDYEDHNVAVVEYSWHKEGKTTSRFRWCQLVSLVSEEELIELMV